MKVDDVIYGPHQINERIFVDLIESQEFQRLKGIAQYGIPDRYYNFKGFSRYEHSIGVMLLLKKVGASLEEQTAGLLHDVSCSAFSHVIDWIVGDISKENYQDVIHKKFILKSNIPTIIKKYGFDINAIADIKRFSLLEKESPNLCADRVDYTLRELFHTWSEKETINLCVKSLINYNGELVFNNKEAARFFGEAYLKCQTKHWSGFEVVTRYHAFSKMLKLCIQKGILDISDLYRDDDFVMDKIYKSNDTEIISMLEPLKSPKMKNGKGATIILQKKFRYIDPKYLESGKLVGLSEFDQDYKDLLEQARKHNQAGITFAEV